jgi:hypothetical protein
VSSAEDHFINIAAAAAAAAADFFLGDLSRLRKETLPLLAGVAEPYNYNNLLMRRRTAVAAPPHFITGSLDCEQDRATHAQ